MRYARGPKSDGGERLAMPSYLLDTNVLVEHLRQRSHVTAFLERLALAGDLCVSVLSEAEVYSGMRKEERTRTEALFQALTCCEVTGEIAQVGGDYHRAYRDQGTSLVDALIAATATVHSLILVTYNHRHFPMPDVPVVCPPTDGAPAVVVRGDVVLPS
jgi:predicted nucleic acid-binding protein